MTVKRRSFCLVLFLLTGFFTISGNLYAAQKVEKKDTNEDGKTDTWLTYGTTGELVLEASDKSRGDGKPDRWVYYRNGAVTQREWDLNFDGKPDFRTLEVDKKFLEKQYDDNFEGKFEKFVKAPIRGSSGKI